MLGWVVFGLLVGAAAKLLMPGRDPGGIIVTAILGLIGAAVGGMIGRAFGLYTEAEPAGFLGALFGALVVLLIYRLAVRRRRILR